MSLTDEWKTEGGRWALSGNVAVGTPEVIELPQAGPSSIAVVPGGGGTALVEYTVAPLADVKDESCTWFPWTAGAAAAATEDARLVSTTAFRVTAAVAPCRVEILQ